MALCRSRDIKQADSILGEISPGGFEVHRVRGGGVSKDAGHSACSGSPSVPSAVTCSGRLNRSLFGKGMYGSQLNCSNGCFPKCVPLSSCPWQYEWECSLFNGMRRPAPRVSRLIKVVGACPLPSSRLWEVQFRDLVRTSLDVVGVPHQALGVWGSISRSVSRWACEGGKGAGQQITEGATQLQRGLSMRWLWRVSLFVGALSRSCHFSSPPPHPTTVFADLHTVPRFSTSPGSRILGHVLGPGKTGKKDSPCALQVS